MRRFAVAVLASGLLGCSQPSPEPPAPATTPEPDVDVKTVAETFETPRLPDDDVDSVAFWKGDAGEWLIATAKATPSPATWRWSSSATTAASSSCACRISSPWAPRAATCYAVPTASPSCPAPTASTTSS